MRGQPGFFDVDDRLKRLSDLGDQLEACQAAVDFKTFRPQLNSSCVCQAFGFRRMMVSLPTGSEPYAASLSRPRRARQSPNWPQPSPMPRRDAAPVVLPDSLRKAAAAAAMLSYTERAPWPPACIRPTAMTAATMASIFSVDRSLSGFSLPAGSLWTLTFDAHQVAIGLPPCCSSRWSKGAGIPQRPAPC
jgi:hypothetical protein